MAIVTIMLSEAQKLILSHKLVDKLCTAGTYYNEATPLCDIEPRYKPEVLGERKFLTNCETARVQRAGGYHQAAPSRERLRA